MAEAGIIMGGFTKLFSRILTSSIWSESNEVRILWITLLAATGPDGVARVTVPGLARLSNLGLQDVEKSIDILSSPDKYSRTAAQEGRRIREERTKDGNLLGFFVYNYSEHRAVDATGAERQRRSRAAKGLVTRDGNARQKTEDRRQTTTDYPETPETSAPTVAGVPKRTWLTPYMEVWQGRFGGTPSVGPLSKALRPLELEHGAGEVLSRWVKYLAQAEASYASPARFAATFGEWGRVAHGVRATERSSVEIIPPTAEDIARVQQLKEQVLGK
jgi:hypothetical protein